MLGEQLRHSEQRQIALPFARLVPAVGPRPAGAQAVVVVEAQLMDQRHRAGAPGATDRQPLRVLFHVKLRRRRFAAVGAGAAHPEPARVPMWTIPASRSTRRLSRQRPSGGLTVTVQSPPAGIGSAGP